MVYKILGAIIICFGVYGFIFSSKNSDKVHMRLFRKDPNRYYIVKNKEYIKAQNITMYLMSTFLVNMGVLGLYGSKFVLLVVLTPLFNTGFSAFAKKYTRMRK